jgi:hypothetical protein
VGGVQCDVAIDKLPALKGVRLRTAQADALGLAVLGSLRIRSLVPAILRCPGGFTFPGLLIRGVSVRTYDKKLLSFIAFYGGLRISKNPEEFVELTKSLNLPAEA